ncbi:MAG TPA: hypothetical protein GX717_08655 [Clostridiaceae bacterium]|nr:hypothetical protein [Clostridiaceae bacterium]
MAHHNILSIDFDFFQNATAEEVTQYYPDGLDLPTVITEITWSSHYAFHKEKLMGIVCDEKKLWQMKQIIRNQKKTIRNRITQSHLDIYEFILSAVKPNDTYTLVNVDLHHDCFNGNQNIDCGNWIKHIKTERPKGDVHWIARETSATVYKKMPMQVMYDFDFIKDMQFDMVFLCRSDSWLPPHLDEDFAKLMQTMTNRFFQTEIDDQIRKPRNMDTVFQLSEEMNAVMINSAPKMSESRTI